MLRVVALRFIIGLAIWAAGISTPLTFAQEPSLSPEGEARRASHRFLFGEFASGKSLKHSGAGGGQVLNEITLSTMRHEIDGELEIALPEGTQRVASMFRYLVFRGENLDRLGRIEMLPYAEGSSQEVSTKTSELYRIKVAAMPVPKLSMPPIRIKVKVHKPGNGAVVITEIALNSQGKLSTTFDDIPYRNLGDEQPTKRVDVRVDLTRELAVGGHVDLERDRFCRYYAAPGLVHESFEKWAEERGFLPGRQIFKMEPALVKGYSPNQPLLTEKANQSGAADLSFFDDYDSSAGAKKAIDSFKSIKFAMCFNDYPEFMSVKTVGRGTPLVEHFDDAAELAAAYIEDQIKDGGRSADYWEVKNESTIKSEWDYHYREKNAWDLLADFHNRVADAVHGKSPSTMVGGPSSAWMQVQVSNFDLYRNQTKFMDLTRDHVDFYSHHFYEDIGSLGAWHRRETGYRNYLLGRVEAILDMFRAHMHETDNIKPMLITECGSLQPGRGPSDYWLRMRTYSAYMHKFMQRPDELDLVVPFAFLTIPWNPESGDTAFIRNPGKSNHSPMSDCTSTPLANWFELWRDFDGRRLPVHFDHPFLDVTAVHRDKQVQLAITNMSGQRVSVNLSGLPNLNSPESVTQRRLFYHDGEIIYRDAVTHQDASAILVDVEETTIVTIELPQPIQSQSTLELRKWYAAGTAIDSASPSNKGYSIDLANSQRLTSAKLAVGVQRNGGLGGPLKGTFNGSPFAVQPDWAMQMQHLFATIEIEVPVTQCKSTNQVQIDPINGLTITSVHLKTLSASISNASADDRNLQQ